MFFFPSPKKKDVNNYNVLGWNCKIVVQSRRFAVIDICDYIIISGICCN